MAESDHEAVVKLSQSSQEQVVMDTGSGQKPVANTVESDHEPVVTVTESGQAPVVKMVESDHEPVVTVTESGQEPVVKMVESAHEPVVMVTESSQEPVVKMMESDHEPVVRSAVSDEESVVKLSDSSQEPADKVAESGQESVVQISDPSQEPVVKRGRGRPRLNKPKTTAPAARKPREAPVANIPNQEPAGLKPDQGPIVKKRNHSKNKKRWNPPPDGVKRGPGRPKGSKTRRDEDWEPSYSYNTARPTRQLKKRQKLEIPLDSEFKWTRTQKEKLLEALYRHSPSAVESISSVVGDKTPQQVEDFINKMVNSSFFNKEKRITRVDPEHGLAPLELWLTLVQGLVKPDTREDHSAQYAKVFEVISRNEPIPEESGFHGLSWKNLYGYVTDLLNDKAVLTPLTSMEALVMLDMIHALNDTLHSSDTQEQRRLLDLKYQLFKMQSADGRTDYTAGISSHNNDFSKVNYSLKGQNGSAAQASSSSSTSTASAPVTSLVTSLSSTTPTSSSSSSSSATLSTTFTLPGSHPVRAANQNAAICVSNNLPTAADGSNCHKAAESVSSSVTSNVKTDSPSTSTSNSAPSFQSLSTKTLSTSIVGVPPHSDNDNSTPAQTLTSESLETSSARNSAPTSEPQATELTDAGAIDCGNSSPVPSQITATTAPSVVTCPASSSSSGTEKAKDRSRSQSSPFKSSDEENESEDSNFSYTNFYCLNPLTIPAHFLSLKPKPEEGEIVISFK